MRSTLNLFIQKMYGDPLYIFSLSLFYILPQKLIQWRKDAEKIAVYFAGMFFRICEIRFWSIFSVLEDVRSSNNDSLKSLSKGDL